MTTTSSTDPTEVFKALGDPIRWNIVQQVGAVEELPCATLEDTLPVSKPTISYHTKILTQAGLIETRKQGRNYFYTLRRDVLRQVMDELWTLAPEACPGREGPVEHVPPRRKRVPAGLRRAASADDGPGREIMILTW